MNKAVFLDRDGTLNVEVNYLYRTEDFKFVRGAIEAIKIFHDLGFKVIVITNQAGIARGYYSEKDVVHLHSYIDAELNKENTYIDAYYYCPHHPQGTDGKYAIECECRKPKTGMIKKAVQDMNVDLAHSFIVGDKEIDVITGKNSGIKHTVLVRSGHPIDEINTVADVIHNDLLSFAYKLADDYRS